MHLRPISPNVDKADSTFASANCQLLLHMYDDFYPKNGFSPPWIGYFVLLQDQVVGSCGFVGQPSNGKVEIAYWTFQEFEGQGIASFACRELVALAWQTDPLLTIVAKTAPAHNPSTKILENNHFVFTQVVQDDEIGDAWLWMKSP